MAHRLIGPAGRVLPALALALLAAGCALSDHARAVYDRQQRAATALIEAIAVAEEPDAAPDLVDRLYAAEDALGAACAPLREAGRRRLEEREIDGALEWAVLDSLDGCAERSAAVEALIRAVDPATAAYFFAPGGEGPGGATDSARRPAAHDDRG
jgi:hypothetical protein